MGNRRKTNAQKALEGTDRKDRHRTEAEFPPIESGEPLPVPDWLISPEAVAKWESTTALLANAGVLTHADLDELAHYCNMHAQAVKQWRADLAPTAAENTQRRLLGTEFGLTPASRSKPGKVASSTEPNPFARHEKRGGRLGLVATSAR